MSLKKQRFFLLLLACIILSGLAAYRVFAQGGVNTGILTFTSTEGSYVFFDQPRGIIYVYNSRNGELASVWKLKRLGDNLSRLQ